MMTRTWQQNLVDQHPELFIRTYRGVPFSPGYPVAGDGWREIVTSLVERVSAAAEGYPIHFVQICERHGRLRVHWKAEANVPKRLEHTIEEAVTRAEARSIYSCLACGAKARLFSSGGRLIPACPDHARGVPVPVRTAIEGLTFSNDASMTPAPSRACDTIGTMTSSLTPIPIWWASMIGMRYWIWR
jgi:hypothetical protein